MQDVREKISTAGFGLLTHVNTAPQYFMGPPEGWQAIELRFDTGVVMYVSPGMMEHLVHAVEEDDPEPPVETWAR